MKKKWLPLIFAACILAGCGDQNMDAEYDKGVKALEAQEYEKAQESFQTLCDNEYRLPEAYRGSGIAYLKEGRYPEAIAALSRSLNNMDNPDEEFQKDVMYYLAQSRIMYGQTDQAVEVYTDVLKLGEDPQTFFLRGNVYMELGELEKAEKDFERSLNGCTDYDMYINVYKIYADHKMDMEGQKFLDLAMELEPVTGEDYFHRGRIYELKKDYSKAQEAVAKSMELEYEPAVPMMGHIYLLMNDVESARRMYKEYLETSEKKAGAYNGLAICDIQEGEYDKALDNIKKGLKLNDPDETQSLMYNEIVALEYKRQFNLAKDKMKKYLELYPDDQEALRENEFLSTR